ncbi:MAG: hypothetical protein ACI91R_001921 [Vicingaceae bacterium]|jgi:hypothetical protein
MAGDAKSRAKKCVQIVKSVQQHPIPKMVVLIKSRTMEGRNFDESIDFFILFRK